MITYAYSAAAGDQSSFWGPIGVEYYYHVSPVVGIGAVASYASCKVEDEKTRKDDLSESFITVMPSVKFNWLRKKNYISSKKKNQIICKFDVFYLTLQSLYC